MSRSENPRASRPKQVDSERERDEPFDSRASRPNDPGGQRGWDEKHPNKPTDHAEPRNRSRGWPDAAISAIAASQRTLVTHAQLTDLKIGRSAIRHAVARGRLHRVHYGVYSLVPVQALPPLATEQAAILACGHEAFLSHHSAAALWGIRPARRGPVEITLVGRDAGRRRNGLRVHRVATLDRRDRRVFKEIPLTSPARTLLDIARDLDTRELERAFEEALIGRLTSRPAIAATLEAARRHPGAGRLRPLLQLTATVTRSEAEKTFLELVRAAGIAQPEANVRLGRWEVDFLWRAQRLVVEVDGYSYHSSRAALERDHRKDEDLQGRALFVLRFSPRAISQQPLAVAARVASALARPKT